MAVLTFTFVAPTDSATASEDLDILIYNGTLGNEVLFTTVLANDPNKSIVGANMIITGVSASNDTLYNFSAKARNEADLLSINFSPITQITTSGGSGETTDVIVNSLEMFTGLVENDEIIFNGLTKTV